MPEQARPIDSKATDLAAILADRDADFATLLALWQTPRENRSGWARDPDVYRRFGERMLRLGEPLLAYDLIDEGLALFPGDPRLRQLQALALARSGDSGRALSVLATLRDEGHADEETLGLLARTYKDLGVRAAGRDATEAHDYFRHALETYADAHARHGGSWTGINAASMALVLGDEAKARALAALVREQGLRELERAEADGGDTYWPTATLGEAALILGDLEEAERRYARVAEDGWRARRFGDLSSTRRQARLLLEKVPAAREIVGRCFRTPRVALFVGHMIDGPNRASPRFPARLEAEVRAAIRERLERSGALIGYASAACGSDILFLEVLLELGGEAHVVLPYDRDQFVAQSVEILPGTDWGERFRRVLDRSRVLTASPQRLEIGGVSYDFANMMAQGLATLRADQLDADLVPMAVWDGRPGDGAGGTASSVERWRGQGLEVDVIDLAEILSRHDPAPGTAASIAPGSKFELKEATAELGSQIVAILFADVVGFSKLTEEEIPRFVKHFLGMVAERLATVPPESVVKKNTWGDGLFFVFEDVCDAGRLALDLRDQVVNTRWEEKGLPAGLNMRIALHAGPVYLCTDPVTERRNCIGTHVSHAARIEPITPPGQVFASQAFAALAAAQRVREFRCHYVGQTPLAKGYGIHPTYHVHPYHVHRQA
jgi:class 3 adenylate cyclase/tetratricopeptide (TPR) repeat protein